MTLARPLDLLFFARLAPFVVQEVFLSFRKAAEAFKFTESCQKPQPAPPILDFRGKQLS